MKFGRSVRQRISALVAALLVAFVAAFAAAAYYEMRTALTDAATDRLSATADQVSRPLGADAAHVAQEVKAAATAATLRSFISSRNVASVRTTVMNRLREMGDQANVSDVEIWDANGQRLATTVDSISEMPRADVRRLLSFVLGNRGGISPIISVGGVLEYTAIAPIAGSDPPLGFVVSRRRLTDDVQYAALRQLVSSDARLLIGNAQSDLWTDLRTRRPAPPLSAIRTGNAVEYSEVNDTHVLALVRPIQHTPWALALEMPLARTLAPARAVALDIAMIGALLAFMGIAIVCYSIPFVARKDTL